MFIQALINYYNRMAKNQPQETPSWGWSLVRVVGKIVIDGNGKLKNVIPADTKAGWKLIVPQQDLRDATPKAYLFCDSCNYLLGTDSKKWENSKKTHIEFLEGVDTPAARAARRFFERFSPEKEAEFLEENKKALKDKGKFVLCFKEKPLYEYPEIKEKIDKDWHPDLLDSEVATSIISGEIGPCSRKHPCISGLVGSPARGSSLINCSVPSFEAFGESEIRGMQAPMLVQETHAYSTALDLLLNDKNHKSFVGNTTLLFWSEENNANSNLLKMLMEGNIDGGDGADDDIKLKNIIELLRDGVVPANVDLNGDFYVIGLEPNQARIMVRFVWQSSFKNIIKSLVEFYRTSSVAMADSNKPSYVRPWNCMLAIEKPHSKGSTDASLPHQFESLMKCALHGSTYPRAIYQAMLERVKSNRVITQEHAVIARGYLTNHKKVSPEDIGEYLNDNYLDTSYILGQMFMLYEKIQNEAQPTIASNIRNKSLVSAINKPKMTFERIDKTNNYYIKKLARTNRGLAQLREKQLNELKAKLESVPKNLSYTEQGKFVLGYFQEKTKLFRRNDSE